jgi:hypothetical protein
MDIKQQEAALKLANYFLDPELGGYSVGPWVRDMARMVVGIAPVECVEKPRIKLFCGGGWMCISSRAGKRGDTPVEAYTAWMLAHV